MSCIAGRGVFTVSVDQHPFVIALDAVEPGITQELQAVQHAWPAINNITYCDYPILCSVEPQGMQATVKIYRFKVDVADYKISSVKIDWKAKDFRVHRGEVLQNGVR